MGISEPTDGGLLTGCPATCSGAACTSGSGHTTTALDCREPSITQRSVIQNSLGFPCCIDVEMVPAMSAGHAARRGSLILADDLMRDYAADLDAPEVGG